MVYALLAALYVYSHVFTAGTAGHLCPIRSGKEEKLEKRKIKFKTHIAQPQGFKLNIIGKNWVLKENRSV